MVDFNYGDNGTERHARLVADADLYRAYFSDQSGRRKPASRNRRETAWICRAVEAVTRCRWPVTTASTPGPSALSSAGRTALDAIEQVVRGNLGSARLALTELATARAEEDRDANSWAVSTAARAVWIYATGETHPSLTLPVLMERLLTLLPSTSQPVRDLLCFSLALAAYAQHDAALAAFLLGHRINALASTGGSRSSVSAATRAAFGFSIIGIGDAATGRRILLGVNDTDQSARAPLFCGIVDAELVALQTAAGDSTSAAHWMGRTRRFAERYGCDLLLRRAVDAKKRVAIK
jgi:hypothetical protein